MTKPIDRLENELALKQCVAKELRDMLYLLREASGLLWSAPIREGHDDWKIA